ncbi:DUF6392 family protein [Enterobacter bugandensis]|uniref:DUF6392 family protein n=1 Tax=Enterobacter bugandensis TaxID=881260 RepID=UPI002004A41A|nr:DUF6392 family protein [Enterobacter bugandensis]MCK6753307.1 DUF6392 family protein [Enterobacter bugandensis]MCK6765793.1 DUF6392 family protein [Enterobacter bugandensis]HED6262215.1 pyocin immunity protein [Enterobacter bugandensis]
MTVNINALIDGIGKTYQELFDEGLIPYKTKPTGYPGDPDLTLDMAREGVHLTFKREGRLLWSVILSLQHDNVNRWSFPNELPSPLKNTMSRTWTHETLGEPERCSPPEVIMKRAFGWTDIFTVSGRSVPMSMQVNYDIADMVSSVVFLPTSELRW